MRNDLWRLLSAVFGLFAALAGDALAQGTCQVSVRVANPATVAQARWVTVAVPASLSEVADGPRLLGDWLAFPGPRLGAMSQLWHVFADVPAGGEVLADQWRPTTWAGAMLPALSRAAALLPTITLQVGTAPAVSAPMVAEAIEWSTPAGLRVRFGLHALGWHATAWETVWAWQEAVDVAGFVVWCDSATPAWSLPLAEVRIAWPGGGRAILHHGERFGQTQGSDGSWRIYRGAVPDAVAMPFRGTLLPATGDVPEEPLVAVARWPDGAWFGFGCRPYVPGLGRAITDGWLDQAGGMWDARPGALLPDAGSTGAQAPFGAQVGLPAAGGDPWALRALSIAADDGLLRTGHYLERDGRPVTTAAHPGWHTWGLATHVASSTDTLGKSRSLPQPPRIDGRNWPVDDQHRGDGPEVAAYALTGDPVLQADLLLRLNADEAAIGIVTRATDAPRASGRLLQSWAKCAMVSPPVIRDRWLALADDRFARVIAAWAPASPMRPTWTTTDVRLLPGGLRAWCPWQEGLLVLGCREQSLTRDALHVGGAGAFDLFARALAPVVSTFGVLQTTDGQWVTGYALEATALGELPFAGYLTLPRSGANFDASPGTDLHLAGVSWVDWMAGAVTVAALTGDAHAQAVLDRFRPPAWSVTEEQAQWWAVR